MSKESSRSSSDKNNNIRNEKLGSGSGSIPRKQWESVVKIQTDKENNDEEKIIIEYQKKSMREPEKHVNNK